jgi:hypothetical protein
MPRKTKILVRRKTAGGRTKARVPVTRSHTRNAKGPKSKKKSGRRSRRTRSRSAKGASPPRYRNGDPDTDKDTDTNIVIKDIGDRTGPPPAEHPENTLTSGTMYKFTFENVTILGKFYPGVEMILEFVEQHDGITKLKSLDESELSVPTGSIKNYRPILIPHT